MASTLQHRPGLLNATGRGTRVLRRVFRYVGMAILALVILLGAAVAVTQTSWFKNWLRQKAVAQAAQYLNGELMIGRLTGTLFSGVQLQDVSLVHDGETAVRIERLTVDYNLRTIVSQGVVIDALTLVRPTILIERNERGWNVNQFVKTRRGTGGRGAPPITLEAIALEDAHLIIKSGGRTVEELSGLDARFRFAYQKPGIAISIGHLSARLLATRLHRLVGDLRFDRGAVVARDLVIETDRSRLVTTLDYAGPSTRAMTLRLQAEQLSLPEIGRYFSPLARIQLEPAVLLDASGTIDELKMDVELDSAAGSARGPLVGHFGRGERGLEGTLEVENVDMAPILNRDEWKTHVDGQARFTWRFQPARIDFDFAGPGVRGFGYEATSVRASGVYDPAELRFRAAGNAYGAAATTRAAFRFATPARPLSYALEGTFTSLDLRRLPERLPVPDLDTNAAGRYRFEAAGRNWRASAEIEESSVEGATFAAGTILGMESQGGELRYSATGNVADLNPRRFAAPLEAAWLDDERFEGGLTGSLTFEGSGRTTDELVLDTKASLTGSTLAGAAFPSAETTFRMADRTLQATFAGPFEHLPGSLFTDRRELSDTTLHGQADLRVELQLPRDQPVELTAVGGRATLTPSTVAGLAVDMAQFAGEYADRTAHISELVVKGPELQGVLSGTVAFGAEGESNFTYDISMTNLARLAERTGRPMSGAARASGEAHGPASHLVITGTLAGNRLQYGTNVDALSATSTYKVTLPDFDAARASVDADTAATFVTIYGNNLASVTARTVYDQSTLDFDTSFDQQRRSLGLGGRVILHPDHNEIHLRALNVNVGQTQWALPAGQEAVARYSSDSVTIDNFVLQRGEQQLTAVGTVAVGEGTANVANSLDVRLDNVQVRDINELLLGNRALTGILNANAEVRGTRNEPIVRSRFALTKGSVEGVSFNALNGQADYAGRAVDLDLQLEQSPAAMLTAVGTVPVPNGPGRSSRTDEIDLTVKSTTIDLGLLQPATTQVTDIAGQFSANVQVGGTLERPSFDGLVETSNAAFTVAATGVRYDNGSLRLRLDDDRFIVDRFQISDDDSDLLVAIGEVGLVRTGLTHLNMQLSGTQFKVLDNEFGSMEVDADLRFTGDAAKPDISGEIISQAGRLEVDRLLDSLTRNTYRTQPASGAASAGAQAAAAAPTPRGLYDRATVNVRVRLPDDVLLRGRNMHASFSHIGLGDMNITVGGDLMIRKDPSSVPDVIGTVTVVRGYYDFQGRRFQVLRDSQIRFQGWRPIDPALQVTAERVISGVTAIVNIRGTMRQPQVRLSSEPPLDEADVLSLIVFNQPINQLGEGQRLNLAERAGGLAVGYLATPLANSIARALDLDIFEIRATGGENNQPSVALGQQLGSRLFVSFRQEFGPQDLRQLSLEYRINELLRLVSTVTQGSLRSYRLERFDTTGVDLIYTISY